MTKIQAKDLLITMRRQGDADFSVIAYTTDCELKIDANTQKTASPSDGDWEHHIVKRKGWAMGCGVIETTDNFYDGLDLVGAEVGLRFANRAGTRYYEGTAIVTTWKSNGGVKGRARGQYKFLGNGALTKKEE